ncbi:hypothetical protein BIFGAL_04114 [Bifidobacterium gallicum DSM 20093 = LMG 11596]|uniref:Uncharacterized protein n=1 Tax=Bifidobacterium gallicum DSM 20093 = LMG 11596 TaxID=561180 RepID=D1NW67_9BIFI|nr:hypothetical protein BIFGAL_04114 [Bifidobacterium gallicum DSM 20093 = LMG 11596]
MRFATRNCTFPDHAGQGRCGLRRGTVPFLTTLVRGDAVCGGAGVFLCWAG